MAARADVAIVAIQAALGADADGVVVSATKSMTGHLLGGAGAIESVASVKALADRVAPPTINLDDLDDEVTISVATKATPLAPHAGADGPMSGSPSGWLAPPGYRLPRRSMTAKSVG